MPALTRSAVVGRAAAETTTSRSRTSSESSARRPRRPASSVPGRRPRRSLPSAVWVISLPRTRAASGLPSLDSRTHRTSLAVRGRSRSRTNARTDRSSSGGTKRRSSLSPKTRSRSRGSIAFRAERKVTARTSGSPPSRRSANARTDAVDRSSHWRSSTAIRIGRSAIAARRSARVARPSARRSGGPAIPDVRPSAGSSTFRCQCGRAGPNSSMMSPRMSPKVARPISNSGCAQTALRTRRPDCPAIRTASSSRRVLPIPASPSMTSPQACGRDPPTSAAIVSSSRSRPRISGCSGSGVPGGIPSVPMAIVSVSPRPAATRSAGN